MSGVRAGAQSGRRPWMIRISTTTIASTSRMWMNPPIVYELTSPRAQSTMRMIAMVHSMLLL